MVNWDDVKLRSFKEVRRVYIQLMDMRYYILAYRNRDSTIADRGQEEWEKIEGTLERIEAKHDRDYLQLLVKSPHAVFGHAVEHARKRRARRLKRGRIGSRASRGRTARPLLTAVARVLRPPFFAA